MKFKKLFFVAFVALLLLGSGDYCPTAVDFDGTNDYLNRAADLTGNADGKEGILSVLLRLDGGNGSTLFVYSNNTGRFCLRRLNTNVFQVKGYTAGAVSTLDIRSKTAYTAGASWIHFLASWNLAGPTTHMYLNDIDDLQVSTALDNAIDYTNPPHVIGGDGVGANKFNGAMAEFYFAEEYLDFSVEANRRKFITAALKPVDLGATGNLPTGTSAIIYYRNGWAAGTNSGTGGNFTVNGTLDATSFPCGEWPWWIFRIPRN